MHSNMEGENTNPNQSIDINAITDSPSDSSVSSIDINSISSNVSNGLETTIDPNTMINSENNGVLNSSDAIDFGSLPDMPIEQNNQEAESQGDENKLILGDDGMAEAMNNTHFDTGYWKLFMFSFVGLGLFSLVSVGLYFYNSYLIDLQNSVVEPKYDTYIKKYDKYKKDINVMIGQDDGSASMTVDLSSDNAENDMMNLIKNTDFSYVPKKDILQVSLNNLIGSTIASKNSINESKNYISKNGFFTQELKDLLKDQENASNIKRSMISLEIIKFSSAINVFYYLDTFIDGLSKSLNLDKDSVIKKMEKILSKGENDLMVYLNDCYLNPFEIDSECNVISDFDTFYTINKTEDMDISFFKRLMYYIDLKLEQTDFPSFSILFNGFNANSNDMSFSIKVDTFKQDEISLLQKGILNPHIFVVNNLLNFLKQSKFIVGKDISSKNITINPQIRTIGNNQFNVNNSTINFSLPIQKITDREIFDFVEIKK